MSRADKIMSSSTANCLGFTRIQPKLSLNPILYEELKQREVLLKDQENLPPFESKATLPLVQWMEGQTKTAFKYISIDESDPQNRRFVASQDITAHTLLCAIEFKFTLSSVAAKESPIGLQLSTLQASSSSSSQALFLSDHIYLSCYLLYLKHAEHPEARHWKPYFDSLPTSYPTFTVNWPDHELTALQGT